MLVPYLEPRKNRTATRISVAKIRFDRINHNCAHFITRKEKNLLDEGIDDTKV